MRSIWRQKWEIIVLPLLQQYGKKAKIILDVGCGRAYYRHYFGDKYVGLDVERTFPKDEHQYIRSSGTNLPFQDKSIDFILCVGVLEHVEKNLNIFFEEFNRVLKKNGLLVVGVPSKLGLRYETSPVFKYWGPELERYLTRFSE